MSTKQSINQIAWIFAIGVPVLFTIFAAWYLLGGEGIRLLHAAETPYDIGAIAIFNISSAIWLLGVGYGLFYIVRELVSHLGEQARSEGASEVEKAE